VALVIGCLDAGASTRDSVNDMIVYVMR